MGEKVIKTIIYSAFILLIVIPLTHFIFGGDWLWYWLIDGVLLLIYVCGLFWLYDQLFQSFNKSEMEVAKSNPQKELDLSYEEMNVFTSDGTPLNGWYIPSPIDTEDKPVIIYSHGFGLSKEQLGDVSYRQFDYFVNKGYSILTFDYPIGNRENAQKVSGGVLESEVLSTVVRFAKDRGHQFVCLFGYSYGGNTSLYYAVNQVDPLVDAIIVDSSIVVTPEIFAKNLQVWMGIPSMLSNLFLPLLWNKNMGYSAQSHPINYIYEKPIHAPILFWHGTSDRDAFWEEMKKIYTIQTHPMTTLRIVEEGEHVELHNKVGERTYNQETIDWLEKVRSTS